MKTIEHAGLMWEVHSPSLFVHQHAHDVQILVGCNGQSWQLGINDAYRDRCFATRQDAMQAYADGFRKACELSGQWSGL